MNNKHELANYTLLQLRSGTRLKRSQDWKDPPAPVSDLLVIGNGSLYADAVPTH